MFLGKLHNSSIFKEKCIRRAGEQWCRQILLNFWIQPFYVCRESGRWGAGAAKWNQLASPLHPSRSLVASRNPSLACPSPLPFPVRCWKGGCQWRRHPIKAKAQCDLLVWKGKEGKEGGVHFPEVGAKVSAKISISESTKRGLALAFRWILMNIL